MILICLDDNGYHSLCVRLFDDFVMCCGVVLLVCVLLFLRFLGGLFLIAGFDL